MPFWEIKIYRRFELSFREMQNIPATQLDYIIYFSQFYITKVKIYLHLNWAKGVEVSGKNYFSLIWAILGVQNSHQSQIWSKLELRNIEQSSPAGINNLFLPILYNKGKNLFTPEMCKRCWGIWEKLFQPDLSNSRV